MRRSDADRLLRFVRVAAPAASTAASLTRGDGGARAHAERLVGHWRREGALVAAVPGLGGRLSLIVVEVLAATAQGLLVLSLADVADVDDEAERVGLVARLVLDERLPRGWSPAGASDPGQPADDDEDSALWATVLKAAPGTLATAAAEMWGIRRLAARRRSGGKLWHKGLRFVPVVGALGALLAERDALAEIARLAYAELGLGPADSAAA